MKKKATKKTTRAKKITLAKGVKVARGKEEKLRKKPGSSNTGKYKSVSKGSFCGSAGGASSTSYPVNSSKRCHAALAYAHNAPNPEGIKKCVYAKCKFKTVGKKGKKK